MHHWKIFIRFFSLFSMSCGGNFVTWSMKMWFNGTMEWNAKRRFSFHASFTWLVSDWLFDVSSCSLALLWMATWIIEEKKRNETRARLKCFHAVGALTARCLHSHQQFTRPHSFVHALQVAWPPRNAQPSHNVHTKRSWNVNKVETGRLNERIPLFGFTRTKWRA